MGNIGTDKGELALGIGNKNRVQDVFDCDAVQFFTLLERPLGGALGGLVVKDQHHTDDLPLSIEDRRSAVGNGALCPVSGDKQGVVGQPHYFALPQDTLSRIFNLDPGFFVDYAEYFIQWLSKGLNFTPPCEAFGNRIYPGDSAGSIRDHNPVTDAVECRPEFFQSFVCLLLRINRQFLIFHAFTSIPARGMAKDK